MNPMRLKEKILYILMLLFFAAFFTNEGQVVTGVGISGLVLYALFFNSFKEKWALLKERKYILAMLLFFAMLLISIQLSEDKGRGFRYLDTRLPLLYFPLSIGLLNLRKEFKDRVLLGLAIITTVVCLFCLGWALYRANGFQHPEFLYNDSLTEILGRQSIYISLLVTLSIFIYGYWAFFKGLSGNKRAAVFIAILFLYIISFLLASRNLMLVLYTLSFSFLAYYLVKRKKYLEIATVLIGITLGAFLLFKFSPKTLNRFKELTFTQFDYSSQGAESHYNMEVSAEQWNGANFRLAAWPCALELFQQKPVLGVGLGDKQHKLLEEYKKRGFQFAIDTKKNIHSNYLDVLYGTGIIAFVLFLVGWLILPIIKVFRYRDWLSLFIILTLAIAMVTEVYFDRTIGGWIVGFLIPFLLTDLKKKRQP
ncbi:MAG: hypothetical protein JWP69_1128 [Flaviaesturariibacter sp.]|nr:hypothetical protein [Flaviaesturariibacter sp.]